MPGMSGPVTGEKSPCGRKVDARHLYEQDDQGLVIDDTDWACGCRRSRREYHDGCMRLTVVRHNGKILEDALDADE